MFGFGKRKVLKVDRRTRSVRPKDPLYEFRKSSAAEFRKYDLPSEVWKSLRRLCFLAAFLFAVWFLYECWLSWNIFQ